MNMVKQAAFSLIELLVAISIVAVITAVGINSFSGLQKSGRDTQRQADLRMLQSALQQYYANENHYPDTLVLTAGAALSASGRTYLQSTPKDPVAGTTTPYCYTSYLNVGRTDSASTCTSSNSGLCHFYKLDAKLENGSGNITCTSSLVAGYNFEVTPL
jgi:prepilin-type N-terminal cleavage/methylation domain-containing protein